jgi:hypothetical protein
MRPPAGNAPVSPLNCQASLKDTGTLLISAEVDTLKTTERTKDVSKEDTRMRNTIKLKTEAVATDVRNEEMA